MYNFDEYEVSQQVFELMSANGIVPAENIRLNMDGQIHRFRVADDKTSEKSGAYCVAIDDWPHGFIWEWRKSINIGYSFRRDRLNERGQRYFTDAKYAEILERSRKNQEKLKAKLEREQEQASCYAKDYYAQLPKISNDFPYLVKKKITLPTVDGEEYSGLRYDKNRDALVVPLRKIKGDFASLQYIKGDGEKRFQYKIPTKGAFYSLDLQTLEYDSEKKLPILIGEGVATMLTVYELTGRKFPIVAAMSCGNFMEVAKAIKEKYKGWKIIMISDNDITKPTNSGLTSALQTCETLKLNGVIYPKFNRRQKGSDWNDYFIINGAEATREILKREIKLYCLPKERQNVMARVVEINAQYLKNKTFRPLVWAVDGLISSGVTVLAGGPKVGKSIFALHVALAVSIGGCVMGKIPVQAGSVLYLALEDTERRLQERMEGSGINNENVSKLTLATAVPRQHEGGLEYIRWWLEDHEDARLVIIDTLQKFRKQLSGKNSMYSEDYDVMAEIKSLADEFDVPFLIIHHLKKAEAVDWLNEISGSQGIAGAADTIMSMKRERNSNEGVLYITGRDVEEREMKIQLDGFGWILLDGNGVGITENEQKIIDYLQENVKINALTLASLLNITDNNARVMLSRMVKKRLITRVGFGTYALPDTLP